MPIVLIRLVPVFGTYSATDDAVGDAVKPASSWVPPPPPTPYQQATDETRRDHWNLLEAGRLGMLGDDIRVNQLYMIFLASPYALLIVLGRWDVAPWILGAGESARITLLTMITLKGEVAFLAKVSRG